MAFGLTRSRREQHKTLTSQSGSDPGRATGYNSRSYSDNYTTQSDNVSSVNCIIHITGEGDGTAFTEIGTAARRPCRTKTQEAAIKLRISESKINHLQILNGCPVMLDIKVCGAGQILYRN